MRSRPGIEIEQVAPGSPAQKAGLASGDVLLALNSFPLNDVIDFMFHRAPGLSEVEYSRAGETHKASLDCESGGDIGITIKPFKVKTCRNNCIFCFVKQLPKGLRKALYVKDEDYRLSFLHGNYMTLSNLDAKDRQRIISQRLSPLYLSVHSTNRQLRNKMLGNPRAADIMKELKFFSDRKIRFHAQIVLCPGYNDGKELQSTIKDLFRFYPYLCSIAVVPVGLTLHRKLQLAPVTKDDALAALSLVETFQKRFVKKHGDPIVYCSDEMFIRAGHPFPPLKEYGGLHQIENGVGMVPLFQGQARKLKVPKALRHDVKFLTFTGTSFFPFLKKFVERLSEKEGVKIDVLPVENNFFGTTVTVAGLLTGRDVVKTLHDNVDSYNVLLVPDVMLKEDEDIFLDDVSLSDIEEATGLKTIRITSTPQGLVDAMTL